jgi:hypothetical protein
MGNSQLLPLRHHRARILALIILALAPLTFGALALALGQDANWDLRNYHWYNAYALLHWRYGFDLLPAQTPSFYNPALDVPFYLLATHVPAKVAGFALGFIQGLNFILLFMLAHLSLAIKNPWRKTGVCAALATIGMLGGGGISLIGTTFYDNVTSLGLFTSALLVICYRDRLMTAPTRRAFKLALLFGLPTGLMMGLKLPAVIFALGFCFGILFMGGSIKRLFFVSFAFGLGVLLGIVVALGPWAWFLQVHYGSPLFPYFNEFFQSPLAPLSSARDEQFLPRNLHDALLFPFLFAKSAYRVGEIEWRDWAIPIFYAALPAAIVLRLVFGRSGKNDLIMPHAARYLLAAGAISYAAWLLMFCIYRYLVPLEMLAPLLIVLAIGFLPGNLPLRAVLAACLLLAIAFSIQPGNWTRRESWLDRFVEAQIPPLPDHKDLMILMAGIEPYSHVIPEFPPDIPFVRIESNFARPEEAVGINRIIRDRVEAHQGPFMLLMPPWQLGTGEDALAAFHLKLDEPSCQTVVDRLYDDKPLSLCKVDRQP